MRSPVQQTLDSHSRAYELQERLEAVESIKSFPCGAATLLIVMLGRSIHLSSVTKKEDSIRASLNKTQNHNA